jgi:anti-anti-sigma factor
VSPEVALSVTEVRTGTFEVAGEIDAHSAPDLADRLSAVEVPVLVLDLSEVSFMDSSGLRVIVELHQRQVAAGGSLEIRRPSRPVSRLFDLGGLGTMLALES